MDTHLSSIAQQLAVICSSSRPFFLAKGGFTRAIYVTEDTKGGSIDVSFNQVCIHPFFFTEGDPLATIQHVLDVCQEFDELHAKRTQQAIIDLKDRLRKTLLALNNLDPSSVVKIINEVLVPEDAPFEIQVVELAMPNDET